MASPVEFRQFTPRDSRRDLMRRLDQAPADHAEALLECYDLLQRLHEKGLIDLLNGLLSASETVIEKLADVVSSRQAVAGLRVALMLSNLLTELDTDHVHTLLSGSDEKPPSLLRIAGTATSADVRRGMAAAVGLLEIFGKALHQSSAGNHGDGIAKSE